MMKRTDASAARASGRGRAGGGGQCLGGAVGYPDRDVHRTKLLLNVSGREDPGGRRAAPRVVRSCGKAWTRSRHRSHPMCGQGSERWRVTRSRYRATPLTVSQRRCMNDFSRTRMLSCGVSWILPRFGMRTRARVPSRWMTSGSHCLLQRLRVGDDHAARFPELARGGRCHHETPAALAIFKPRPVRINSGGHRPSRWCVPAKTGRAGQTGGTVRRRRA